MLKRGEIYWGSVTASETKGREQHNEMGQPRAWLIVSDGRVMRAGVVVACPFTTKVKPIADLELFRLDVSPDMIQQTPGDTGQLQTMLLLCEQIRVMGLERLKDGRGHFSRLGKLKPAILAEVDQRLLTLLSLKG